MVWIDTFKHRANNEIVWNWQIEMKIFCAYAQLFNFCLFHFAGTD